MTTPFLPYVKQQLARRQVAAALQRLEAYLRPHNAELYNEILLFQARCQRQRDEQEQGVVTPDEARVQENRLIAALHSFCDKVAQRIEWGDLPAPPPVEEPEPEAGPPAAPPGRLSSADRQGLVRHLAHAPGWRTGGHTERYGFLLAAGLPDAYLAGWTLGGPSEATAARVVNGLEGLGFLADDPNWRALGLLARYLCQNCPEVEGQAFLRRLIRDYGLTRDEDWL